VSLISFFSKILKDAVFYSFAKTSKIFKGVNNMDYIFSVELEKLDMIFRNNKIFKYYIMTRKLSDWNVFVKKVYTEGKAKNPNYKFKEALEDASKRKSEMKHTSISASSKTAKNGGKSIGRSRRISMAGGRKSRRHRKH
jgi:hypothetical protein